MSQEPIVMTPEQLWALNDDSIEQYRGKDVEIEAIHHKLAKDSEIFAQNLPQEKLQGPDELHIIGPGSSPETRDDFFDYVAPTIDQQ